MYTKSRLTGKIYLNGYEIIADDRNDEWKIFIEYVIGNNEVILIEGTPFEIKEIEDKKIKEGEFQLYLKRKTDGENAYLKLSAEFRLAKLSGQISEATHSYLEELLTPVRNEVMFGQWKKGLSILESIGISQIGAELYNRLHLQITNYISENY